MLTVSSRNLSYSALKDWKQEITVKHAHDNLLCNTGKIPEIQKKPGNIRFWKLFYYGVRYQYKKKDYVKPLSNYSKKMVFYIQKGQ